MNDAIAWMKNHPTECVMIAVAVVVLCLGAWIGRAL